MISRFLPPIRLKQFFYIVKSNDVCPVLRFLAELVLFIADARYIDIFLLEI